MQCANRASVAIVLATCCACGRVSYELVDGRAPVTVMDALVPGDASMMDSRVDAPAGAIDAASDDAPIDDAAVDGDAVPACESTVRPGDACDMVGAECTMGPSCCECTPGVDGCVLWTCMNPSINSAKCPRTAPAIGSPCPGPGVTGICAYCDPGLETRACGPSLMWSTALFLCS